MSNIGTVIPFPAGAIKRRADPIYPPAPAGTISVPLYIDNDVKIFPFTEALASIGLHIAIDPITRCFLITSRNRAAGARLISHTTREGV